jgi:hypothetical protein
MRGVLLFNRDGTIYAGQVHTMLNGEVHTGATHNATSRRLFYYHELPPERKIRALESMIERHDTPDRTKTSLND